MKAYLPIKQQQSVGVRSWEFTKIWMNFAWHSDDGFFAEDRLVKYNARLIDDVIVFDTEQDKLWFILRWS